MARNYRETEVVVNKPITGGVWNQIGRISPIDNDQVPDGFLKSVKVSTLDVGNLDMLVCLSTSNNPDDHDDVITAQASQGGAGTVWLSAKRRIRSGVEEDGRNDGVVFVMVLPVTTTQTTFVIETWGKYLDTAV